MGVVPPKKSLLRGKMREMTIGSIEVALDEMLSIRKTKVVSDFVR